MGILDRITTIVRANVHDLLDQAENPELMLDQYIRELESGVLEAREELVNAMADEKRLAAKLEERKRRVRDWEEKAEQALRMGREETARAALRAARAYEQESDALAAGWDEQKDKVADLQQGHGEIQEKLSTIKADRDSLLAKHSATQAKEKLTSAKKSARKVGVAIKGIARMTERLEIEAAKADAREEIAALSAAVREAEKGQEDIEIEARMAQIQAKIEDEAQ